MEKIFASVLAFIMAFMNFTGLIKIENRLEWSEPVCIYAPTKGGTAYPRLYELEDKTFLCGFTTFANGNGEISVSRSTDGGTVWSSPVKASCDDEYNCDNTSFLQLKNGDLLVAYRAVKRTEKETYCSLRVSVSHDKGETWEKHSVIAETLNSSFNGLWEPYLIYIGDSLAVFYANDSLAGDGVENGSQQNIEYRLFENGTWSGPHIVSSGLKTNSRDGMPVVCKLKDGGYALVIEGTRSSNLQHVRDGMFIKLMLSENGLDWNESKAMNIYYPKDRTAAAPFVVCLDDGRLAISFQTDEDSSDRGQLEKGKGFTMKVIVSREAVTSTSKKINFSVSNAPFDIPEEKSALWNGMYLKDGELYACTGSNANGSQVLITKAGADCAPETVFAFSKGNGAVC